MPEIQIRSATALDIASFIALEHDYATEYVWQIDVQQPDESEISVHFRQVRLPRSVQVEYPRSTRSLQDDWKLRSGLLAATLQNEVVGYISLNKDIIPGTTRITDIVVMNRLRRRGIGAALLLAAQDWAREQGYQRLIMEMQPKNYPAICLAQKLGFSFCGYHDHYYANRDIALFFAKSIYQPLTHS